MRRFQSMIGLVLVLVLAASASAAKGNKDVKHAVRGTVETVSPESVVLKVQASKKKGGGISEQTFQLNDTTQFEFVTMKKHAKGEKAEMETKPANLSDLKAGVTVQIASQATKATKVSIIQRKARGKKNAAQE